MENKRSKNDKVSRRKQKAVEAKAGKIGVAKIKEEEKKEEEENKIKVLLERILDNILL